MADEIYPVSHTEKVIAGLVEPISHTEKILALYGGGSGSGGTTNYNALLNKPSINGVELTGNKTLKQLGITNYDDTQVKSDIADLDTNKQDKTDNALDTTDKTVVGAINEINGNTLDNVTFSSDYKNIVINRKSGLNPYTIPIASIIHNAKITELNDVDATNIGDGKTLVYDGATQKHKYVSSTGTDELVKMDSTTDAKHLSELIDKQTIVNDGGILKAKKLDGQNVTIAEINYLKGLTMNVMDLVNAFANGGVKVLNTPVNTHADLSTLDRSSFIDGISYIVYVLADETHYGAKTTYLCDKTSETFFGNADSQRNFTTDPIDLANEVTGKLGTANIDVDALWKLLTINDTYKTLTTKNEVFGTHGAKALYDELVANMGNKANVTDLTTHTNDTTVHITANERTKWNAVDDKIEALKSIQSLAYEGTVVTCENTLASRTYDMIIKGNTHQNASKIESAGENEHKIIILSNNNKLANDINYKEYKKEIPLPIDGGLKLLPNGVYDTIEQRNDGVYLVQRVGKVVLNGSEAWTKSSWSMTNTFKFDFEIGLVAKLFDLNATNQVLCDTFKVVSRNSLDNVANREFENICASNSKSRTLSITISKTKLDNTNTTGAFKQWLSNNPVTVCYELETPVETKLDINDLDLEVYKDITYVTTDNAIKPALSFKVPSNIGGVMQSNSQNINKLYKLSDEVVDKTDLTSHTSDTNIHVTTSERTKWNEVDNKIDKTDITTTIDSTSTNSQVPSASAIYNKTKNRVIRIEKGGDIIVYADSLGNEAVTETIRITNSKNSPYGANDADNDFHYTIYNMYDSRFKRIVAYDIRKNDMYMIMKYGGRWGTWQRVCTTSVADVGLKTINPTLPSTVKSGNTKVIRYRIKNGWVNITIVLNLIASPKFSWTGVATGLPKPDDTIYSVVSYGENGINNASVGFRLISTGELQMSVGSEITKTDWWNFSFSYPVAEQ